MSICAAEATLARRGGAAVDAMPVPLADCWFLDEGRAVFMALIAFVPWANWLSWLVALVALVSSSLACVRQWIKCLFPLQVRYGLPGMQVCLTGGEGVQRERQSEREIVRVRVPLSGCSVFV